MILTTQKLQKTLPNAEITDIHYYIEALNDVLPEYEINTPLRIQHFIAQIGHESGEFRYTRENLNYSKENLHRVFKKYFPTLEDAESYARKPEKIANIVYANRMGNGPTESGDGFKYIGQGLIQLTGKNNYKACSEAIGIDLISNPNLINQDAHTCIKVACWYWRSRHLNELADKDKIKAITKRINGGYNGLDHRKELLDNAKKYLV